MQHPESIGRYQIYGEVGAGGFATVYRAYDPVLDREIAIKVLHPFHARNPDLRARFVREGRALARIRHPDLVQVFDAGESDGHTYLAMEFVPGRSLEEIGKGRQMPLAELLPIVRQVAGALDAVHAAGLVHRDVKPANIRVTEEGRAVLLDLGVAHDAAASQATGSGMIVGTPGFLAPEQIDGSYPVSRRTDVYQLGATVFALLTGQPPFAGETAQVLFSVVSRPPADLGVLRPDLPYAAQGAVAQAMAKLPDFRPATAGAFAAALSGEMPSDSLPVATPVPAAAAPARLIGADAPPPSADPWVGLGTSPTPSTTTDTVAGVPAVSSRRGLGLAAVLVMLLVVGAGAWLLLGRGGEDSPPAESADGGSAGRAAAGGDSRGTSVPESGAIAPGGQPVPVSLTAGNRKVELPFQGSAGQRVSLRLTAITNGVYVAIRRPDGGTVGDRPYFGPDEGFMDPRTLPATGRYVLVVEADEAKAASLMLTLIDVPPDITAPIRPDGKPVDIAITTPGQNALLTFEGRAGQRVSLRLTRLEDGLYVSFVRPDGTLLGQKAYIGPTEGFLDPVSLPVPGRYQIRIDPEAATTGSATLSLYDVADDVVIDVTPGGPPKSVSLSDPGRNAVIKVEGKAGQRISARMTRMTVSLYLSIEKPDGATLGSRAYFSPPESFMETVTLPVAGSYEFLLDPEAAETGNLTITLFDVPPDVTATLTPGSGPAAVSISTPGQAARLTFNGASGQRLTLRLARMTVGGYVSVYAPDGSELQSKSYVSPREATVELKPLPAAGAYEIVIDPERGDIGELMAGLVATGTP